LHNLQEAPLIEICSTDPGRTTCHLWKSPWQNFIVGILTASSFWDGRAANGGELSCRLQQLHFCLWPGWTSSFIALQDQVSMKSCQCPWASCMSWIAECKSES
jgi:hypothetical protein